MLFLFIGPSCSGKSSVADELKTMIHAEIFSGKDYLRIAKNENDAWKMFEAKLVKATGIEGGNSLIYVVSDKNILSKLDSIGEANRVKFIAGIDTLKERFGKRIGGVVPPPVEAMLKRQIADWDNTSADIVVDTSNGNSPKEIAAIILNNCKSK
jgi:hypothetical protein